MRKVAVAAGIGAALGGSFLAYHYISKWWAKRKIDKLKEQAAAGKIPPRQFLEAVIKEGVKPGGETFKIPEATRLPCTSIFSPDVIASIPGGADAINEMRRQGTCL